MLFLPPLSPKLLPQRGICPVSSNLLHHESYLYIIITHASYQSHYHIISPKRYCRWSKPIRNSQIHQLKTLQLFFPAVEIQVNIEAE